MKKGNRKVVDLAAHGFYAGANGVSSEEGLAEIDALHLKMRKELESQLSEQVGPLEARQRTLTDQEQQARERWEQMRERYQQDPPRVIAPLVMLGLGAGMVAAETALLAPALDMMGVTDPTWQFVLAATPSLGSAILLHLALEARETRGRNERLLTISSGVLLSFLIAFGIWRARALTYAAIHSGDAISGFLTGSPTLTMAVIGALTVVIPLAAAFATHYGLHTLSQWWEFRKARRNAKRLKADLDVVTKQVEAAREKLTHDIEAIEHQKKEWQAQFKHYWDLGSENGAKKGSVWLVWLKSFAVALGVGLTVTLLLSNVDVPKPAIWGVIAGFAAGIAAGGFFYRRWDHPSPARFLKQANVRFTDSGRSVARLRSVKSDDSQKILLAEPREGVR